MDVDGAIGYGPPGKPYFWLEDVASVSSGELARVVDEQWTPPVAASARLVSIIDAAAQHLGQAAYIRGIAGRPRRGT